MDEIMIFFVRTAPKSRKNGLFQIENKIIPCALGRSGMKPCKFEGDGVTPIGSWPIRYVMYRPDRTKRPETTLPIKIIKPEHGWCDAPFDRNYNRPVPMPYKASAENLWREDMLYDIIVVLGHNDCPRKQKAGSAIFMHVAKPGYPATEGCIALNKKHLHYVLSKATSKSIIRVLAY